jgi:hypothetical protein
VAQHLGPDLGAQQVGQGDRHQADADGHHDHQLDQGEAALTAALARGRTRTAPALNRIKLHQC